MTENYSDRTTADTIDIINQSAVAQGETEQHVLVGQASQSTISILEPTRGEIRLITTNQGDVFDLQFDPGLASSSVQGNDFILEFDTNDDGTSDAQLVFRNLVAQANSDNSPTLIIGGIEVSADQLLSRVVALSEQETTLETAAGADGEISGGGNNLYSDNLGNIIDLLIAQGVIDPTELSFGLFSSIDENTDPARGFFSLSFNTPGFELVGGFEDTLPNQHLVGGDVGYDDSPFTPGETESAPLQLLFNFIPQDNEVLQSVSINPFPIAVKLFVGGFSPANEVPGPFPVVIAPEDFDQVFLLPPADSDQDFFVSGSATIVDPDTNQASVIPFAEEAIIDAVADVPELIIKNLPEDNFILKNEEDTLSLRLEASLRDTDGSEALSLEISGVPEDAEIKLLVQQNGWELVPGDPVDGFITYNVVYTGNGPAPTSISGTAEVKFNDYTTHNASAGDGRDADGTANNDGPLHITISAVATELETDLGTDELTLENNVAVASETVVVHINEDVPTVEKDIKIWVDETEGDQGGAEIHVTNNVAGVAEAIDAVDVALNTDGLSVDRDNALTQGFVKRNAAVNLYSDGKDDELDLSDVNPVNNDDLSGPQNDTDDQEGIEFVSYNGEPAVSNGPANHMHTTGGDPIYLYSSSENPSVVYGVFGDDAANGLDGTTVAFIAYITSDLQNGLNAVDVYLEQFVSLDHPNPWIDFEHIRLDLEFVVVDDEGDISDPGSLNLYFADDGPFVEVENAIDADGNLLGLGFPVMDETLEETPGDQNAEIDDVLPNILSDPTGLQAIGRISATQNNTPLGDLFNINFDIGADEEGATVEQILELTIGGQTNELVGSPTAAKGLETMLSVTQGTSGPDYAGTTIYLFLENGQLIGRFDQFADQDDILEGIAFRIFVENADDPENADLVFEQYVALDHPDTTDTDEALSLLTEEAIDVGLKLTVKVTDGDDDTAEDSADILLFNDETSVFTIEDDAPRFTPVQNQELITNGSFETNPMNGNGWGTFEAIQGWTNGSGNPFEVQKGNIGGIAPKEGNSKVELDGHNGPDSNATLEQIVDGTDVGEDYVLTFWYAPRPNDGQADSSSFKVLWGDQEVIVKNSADANDGWQKVTVVVAGTGVPTNLTFLGTGQENTLGAYIDGVSLMAAHVVDEDDLPNGSDPDKESVVVSGNLNVDFGTDEAGSIYLSDEQLADLLQLGLKSGGVDLDDYSFDANTGVLTASANGDAVFTVGFDAEEGTFEFTLIKALDHADIAGENILSLSIPFTATDGDDDHVEGFIDLKIVDDVPAAVDDEDLVLINDGDAHYNIAFVLDESGSVGQEQWDLQKDAVKNAAKQYYDNGVTRISIFTFSSDAEFDGIFDNYSDFESFIDALVYESGSTDYIDALNVIQSDFVVDPSAVNRIYFLSDGEPWGENNTPSDQQYDEWNDYLVSNNIDIVGVGIGDDLDHIKKVDAGEDEAAPIIINSYDDLNAALINNQQDGGTANGNLFANDFSGADEPLIITEVVYNGQTYTDNNDDGQEDDNIITILTGEDAKLEVNTLTGAYVYNIEKFTEAFTESFVYTVQDFDGDTSQAILNINGKTWIAADDKIITNITDEIIIPDHVLLENDGLKADHEITNADNAQGGDVNHNNQSETIHFSLDDSGDLPSFDYEVANGDQTENASVEIIIQEGADLTGSNQNDILIAGDGNDSLVGNAGDDIFIGGAGSDVFVFTTEDLGFDNIIADFDPNEGDRIDLRDLFENAPLGDGLENDDLAALLNDYLDISYDGSDTLIKVDPDQFGQGMETTTSIALEGIDLLNGFADSQQLVNSMLDNDNLIVQ
ncbi:hypothetical protein WH95_16140 [Kiloniella litopenaei]|uniref:VWFA domain-containing protein n=1 Tax=Kiloniella litopenaei TaxID=1549748 RepID=A0A0M2R2M8_9PROT|nr:VWA domain-containing protein [Kiloniella litopenaei]KKJ75916.1 hypothetical protein WH95_16140 [Kiloniella litopenaei]